MGITVHLHCIPSRTRTHTHGFGSQPRVIREVKPESRAAVGCSAAAVCPVLWNRTVTSLRVHTQLLTHADSGRILRSTNKRCTLSHASFTLTDVSWIECMHPAYTSRMQRIVNHIAAGQFVRKFSGLFNTSNRVPVNFCLGSYQEPREPFYHHAKQK